MAGHGVSGGGVEIQECDDLVDGKDLEGRARGG